MKIENDVLVFLIYFVTYFLKITSLSPINLSATGDLYGR